MKDNIHRSWKFRNPNKNTWPCPFCNPHTNTINRRGAPAHLRNKHGLSWKKEYLEKPELLFNDRALSANHEHFMQFKELFPDIEIGDNILKKRVFIQIYYFIELTRKALKENDYSQLQKINRRLPKIVIRPKYK